MRIITSADGTVETVTMRRSESADAQQIDRLISQSAAAVFGRVNVIRVLEKANLAVTLANENQEILAHASFFDYPIGDVVDQAHWEAFLHKHFTAECTPLNTLFIHLFVSQPSFATETAKEIVRAVFNTITELQYICLVSPNISVLEPALDEIFEPMTCLSDPAPRCLASICHRHNHCPRLYVRPARVEDHDDITLVFAQQRREALDSRQPLMEIIEEQDDQHHAAVCESDGVAVGFMSVSGNVDVKLLNDCFDLCMLDGLYEPQQAEDDDARRTPTPSPQDTTDKVCVQSPDGREDSEEQELRSSSRTGETGEMGEQKKTESAGPGVSPKKANAFCIQLFIIDKHHEMRSVDFLPYVFQRFPDRDFCIIRVPTLTPEFPLLQNFLRVVPRPASILDQELYVFHRCGLLKSLEVRPAVAADRPAVCAAVEGLTQHDVLLEDLDQFYQARRDPGGTPLQAFVAQVQGQFVGIVIIRNEKDIEYIRSHYNIENFIYFSHHSYEEHAQMFHFVLKPMFQHYAKHFLKETLRLAHTSCLYYRIYPAYNSQKNSCVYPLNSVLICTVPVLPRRQIIYPLEELGINAPSRHITNEQAPFALQLISRKLTMEPKVSVNARIVVVGASETGLSFLQVLAFCPHLRFNNLTLISTHGLPGDYDHDDLGFLSTSHAYSSRDFSQLSLRSCVYVVTGKMTGIKRRAKHVVVSGSRKVPYDHAVLCTGLQYQIYLPTGVDQPVTTRQIQAQSGHRRYTGPVPSNLFTLNDQEDCGAARQWLRNNFLELEDNAVVYGNTLDVYTCVETLLGLGVRGSRIHLVLPPSEPSCFSHPAVDEAVARALEKAEVQVYPDCLLAQMNDGEHTDTLTSVSFTTDAQPLHLRCGVFLNLSSKGVDYDAFKSMNDACLVYNGRLVIDATFHTNDSAIRAAGPLTKFSGRYYAEQWTHVKFNSREVGQALAATLLPFFDPTLPPAIDPPPDTDQLTPIYKQAKVQGGRLPGGYNYLHLYQPSIPPPAAGPFHQHGRDIVTGGVETGNYFCLHLSCYQTVETLTCLSLKPIPVSNYLCLYGKHQLLLHKLSSRYDEGLIHDLYSFFRENWCMAIYHDRFADFKLEIQQIIASITLQGQGKLDEEEDPMPLLKKLFEKSDGPAALKSSALNYLRYNRNHLPMYALPGPL